MQGLSDSIIEIKLYKVTKIQISRLTYIGRLSFNYLGSII